MRRTLPLTLVLALAVCAAARKDPSLQSAGAPARRNGTESSVQAAGCGFLWLWQCNEVKVYLHCRCKRGCRPSFNYYLGFDADSNRYCSNGVYNYGDYCTARYTMRFNQKIYALAKNTAFWVNGRRFQASAYDSSYTVRVNC